jgi:5S rRNA maturation endonuclease (ribonuclease M5)
MTAGTAYDRLLDTLSDAGRTVNLNGSSATAQCPAHDDTHASLSVGHRRDGKGAVLHCHAGCDSVDVLAAIGLSMRDLFDDDTMRDVYATRRDYRYPDGRVVHRKPDKTFPQSGNKKGNALFHTDRIGDATTVYVPEGEKDVEAIEAIGGTAVCSAMGAGKAHLADWSPLAGKNVIVIADRDDAGHKHARDVVRELAGIAASVKVVEAKTGKDAADHIAAGHSLDELVPVDVSPSDSAATAQPPRSSEVPALARLRRILDAVADEVRSRGLPRGCSTSRFPLGSRVTPRRASRTRSRPSPGSSRPRLTSNSPACPSGRSSTPPRNTRTAPSSSTR